MGQKLILASSSPYRRQLLQRLQIPFTCVAPNIDESALENESAEELVGRLAMAKAQRISQDNKAALVIGSDQVASLENHVMGKPGNKLSATEQLLACSGRAVNFYTGLSVQCVNTGFQQTHVELFTVHFRRLSERAVDNYLEREQPYDCAGSFKCEGLGIALFAKMEGDDPTSLEGLPLITLVRFLGLSGVDII